MNQARAWAAFSAEEAQRAANKNYVTRALGVDASRPSEKAAARAYFTLKSGPHSAERAHPQPATSVRHRRCAMEPRETDARGFEVAKKEEEP